MSNDMHIRLRAFAFSKTHDTPLIGCTLPKSWATAVLGDGGHS